MLSFYSLNAFYGGAPVVSQFQPFPNLGGVVWREARYRLAGFGR
jgi:hypothetical protein